MVIASNVGTVGVYSCCSVDVPVVFDIKKKNAAVILCLMVAFAIVALLHNDNHNMMGRCQAKGAFGERRDPSWHVPAAAARWTVFYNIYVPKTKNPFLRGWNSRRLLAIEEQLGQVGRSYAASAGDLIVHYTSIGDQLDTKWLESVCSVKYNMTCRKMAHYSAAGEVVTLTKLHEYCKHRADQTVIYLHNKGSLHPGNGQDRWRRTMTAAATSQLCLEPADGQCNTCGMLFQPLPANHFPGNMWSAQCSYINQLLSPADYHARRPIIDEWIKRQMDLQIFSQKGGTFAMESHYTGNKRYEAEHWLGSHPDLQPCDVSKEPYKDFWLERDRDFTSEFQFAMAPRDDITAGWVWYKYTSNKAALTDPGLRKRDFFLLRGMIYRWLAFYNKVPASDSWIWKWFPDGELWRAAVEEYGGLVAVNALAQLQGTAEISLPSTRDETVLSILSAVVDYARSWIQATTRVRGTRTSDVKSVN